MAVSLEVYALETGQVEFLGASPRQKQLLGATEALPPSMSETLAPRVRTGKDAIMPGLEALELLKQGASEVRCIDNIYIYM